MLGRERDRGRGTIVRLAGLELAGQDAGARQVERPRRAFGNQNETETSVLWKVTELVAPPAGRRVLVAVIGANRGEGLGWHIFHITLTQASSPAGNRKHTPMNARCATTAVQRRGATQRHE